MHFRILLALLGVTLSGCQTAQMRVDPVLMATTPLQVTGANPRIWNAPIAFGSWSTRRVEEGWLWGFGYRLLGIEARYAQQPYRVVFGSADAAVQAECMTRAVTLSRNDLSIDPALGRLPLLGCGFRGAGDGTLRLHATAASAERGTVEFAGETWTLRSANHFAGSPIRSSEPLGYEIVRGADVIAAVETINDGRVWLRQGLTQIEQSRAAVVAAVLLLYTPAQTEV
jgi:hypothetical protein